jgi:hypothetical protein
VFEALFASGILDQGAAHGLGGGTKEVARALPFPFLPAEEAQPYKCLHQSFQVTIL